MQFWMLKNEKGEFAKDQIGMPVVFASTKAAKRDREVFEEITKQKWKIVRKPLKFHKISCRLIA